MRFYRRVIPDQKNEIAWLFINHSFSLAFQGFNSLFMHSTNTNNLFFRFLFCLLIFTTQLFPIQAQEKFWVFFTDKAGVSFDPLEYFDPKTIDRRLKHGIPLNDPTDYPLNEDYVQSVKYLADSAGYGSRWFNAQSIFAYPDQVNKIRSLPFVVKVIPVNVRLMPCERPGESSVDFSDISPLPTEQLTSLGGNAFIDNELDGKGVRIAVFDIGFKKVDTHPAFEHIRKGNRILKTHDFVDRDDNVYHYNWHGTMVLSCIAGILEGEKLGLATGAEFLLARTEKASELYSEEENWLAAAEWADKNGADIISSSLGYTHQRYFKDQMDGQTSLVARAANMAASKGILVVNAAGNEGSSSWYFIGTPADADSVLAVGGVSPDNRIHIDFSSYGPSADKRLKPNLCAFGRASVAGKNGMQRADGTSFSCPLVAGFAACAWQLHPDWDNMHLFHELEKSGHLYPYFDYAHGYGLPQAGYFLGETRREMDCSFDFELSPDTLSVVIRKDHLPDTVIPDDLLYCQIQNPEGYIEKYAVIRVFQEKALTLALHKWISGSKIIVNYRQYIKSYEIN